MPYTPPIPLSEITARLLAYSLELERSIPVSEFTGNWHSHAACNKSKVEGNLEFCVIHNPNPNNVLAGRPQVLRSSGLIEDTCEHGVGHPNPDSLAYFRWAEPWNGFAVHGCDGCCGMVAQADPEDESFAASLEP